MFTPFVLFKYRKDFEEPLTSEGFDHVETIKFERKALPKEYKNKALILDYDQTIRDVDGKSGLGYPTIPDEINLLPGDRGKKINEYKDNGYILCGMSNQSGIHKGILTYDEAVACFQKTNDLLGVDIDFHFCPHQSNPPACYCRKPQCGMPVTLIEKYKLDPAQTIFVGDQKTDETCAKRIGFKYFHADEFFK